jgi:hypothetical protein
MKLIVGLVLAAGLGAGIFAGSSQEDAEVARLRRHFAAVLHELQTRDVSHLTDVQREARATHIERLAGYAARGRFPINTAFYDRHIPYFIDDAGTRCAMAYLIEESGSGGFVRRVADKMNNAYVHEIARDAELGGPLAAWLDANGLTEAEAARIQPAYGPPPPPPAEEKPPVTTAYKVGTGAALATGIGTLALNVTSADLGMSARTQGWLGIGAGTLGLGMGLAALTANDRYATLGVLNGGIGAVAIVAGIQSLLKGDEPVERKVVIAPYGAGTRAAGLMLFVNF